MVVHPPRTEMGDLLFRSRHCRCRRSSSTTSSAVKRRRSWTRSPVRVEIREDAKTVTAVRRTNSWPPPDTHWRDDTAVARIPTTERCSRRAASSSASRSFDIRRGRLRFEHRFDSDTEMVGPMLLTVTDLGDRTPMTSRFSPASGSSVVAGRSVSRAPTDSRSIWSPTACWSPHIGRSTPRRSLPHQPFHPYTSREPLTAGSRSSCRSNYCRPRPCSRSGDELQLDLQGRWFFSRNPLIGQFPGAYARKVSAGMCSIHTGGLHASFLTVPISPVTPADAGA